MVRSYTNIEELGETRGELGETPFEPFKEEQEDGMISDVAL
jgi:hypothetical protein